MGYGSRAGPVCKQPPQECCLPGPEASGAKVPGAGAALARPGSGARREDTPHIADWACAETLAPLGKRGSSSQVAGRGATSMPFSNKTFTQITL